MKYTKLFELLFNLTHQERWDFVKFAELSINTLPKTDLDILRFLVDEINRDKQKRPTEPELMEKGSRLFFDKTDPQDEKARKQWNYTKNRLTDALNRYLALLQLEMGHPAVKDQLLLTFYQDRQLNKNFNSFVKKTKKNLEKSPADYDQEYHKFKLQELLLFQKEGEYEYMQEALEMEEALDSFYMQNKLRIFVEKYNRHRIINSPKPDEAIIREISRSNIDEKSIGIQLFYNIFLMMKDPNDLSHYAEVKRCFYENEKFLAPSYKVPALEYLLNQCAGYYARGQMRFAREYIEHAMFLINNGLYSAKEGFSINKYSNIISMSLALNDFAIADAFVGQYSSLVKHDQMKELKQLNLANILFHKGQIDEALHLLLHHSSLELYFKIIYDKLCIKLYFEKQLEQPLKSKLAAFEKYLNRSKKLPATRKVKHLNFIKGVKALTNNSLNPESLKRSEHSTLDFLWLEKHGKRM